MPYGASTKEILLLCSRLADKLNIEKDEVVKALNEIVREDIARIAQNKKGDNNGDA